MTPIITNHVEKALERLFYQYGDKAVNIRAILSSIVEQVQLIEYTQYELYVRLFIEVLQGTQLDNLGDQVGLPRGGLGDDEYRRRLRTKIVINTSRGLLEEMYSFILLLAYGRTGMLRIDEVYPAGFQLSTSIPFTDEELQFIKASISSVKGIGIEFVGFTIIPDLDDAFRFDVGLGFGTDTDPSLGGKFAKLV